MRTSRCSFEGHRPTRFAQIDDPPRDLANVTSDSFITALKEFSGKAHIM